MVYRFLKRIFDLALSCLLILFLFPLLLPLLILLKLTGEGHVFYLQQRVGYRNKRFNVWKFATMLKDSPNMTGGMITVRDDPRLTPMGKYLRKSKVNELPQLINVVIGDMSFVGPRPLAEQTFAAYTEEVQDTIYNCKPGITGIGSIVFRDEENLISNSNMDAKEFYQKYISPYKGELEQWYQSNLSTLLDFKILFLTAWVIVFPNSNLLYSLLRGLPDKPDGLS
ncbi:MAG: lipid carrier--UDP-N-acetylgalactosaminyltransferase [Bacteroidetes bacterium]|nr:MAG: lipid carrier--UDP-N-acetylgalactosaminyltransferase [Bacteroidota bacterium]